MFQKFLVNRRPVRRRVLASNDGPTWTTSPPRARPATSRSAPEARACRRVRAFWLEGRNWRAIGELTDRAVVGRTVLAVSKSAFHEGLPFEPLFGDWFGGFSDTP